MIDMYDELKQAFDKALEFVGIDSLKSTTLFVRNDSKLSESDSKKAA